MSTITAGTVLQDDEIFRVELVRRNDHLAVKKTAKATTPKTRLERMRNDVYGMEFFRDLAKKYPEFKLYVPILYEHGDDYYVREFIDTEPVVTESMTYDEAAPHLDQLAKLIADIDRLEPYGEVHFVGSSNWRNLYKSIGEWTEENVSDGIISKPHADRVKQISTALEKFISPRIAHGDMSAYKHAYIKDGQIVLIDFENFTPEAARYFDVAWNYTRLYSFATTTDIPKHFLNSFLQQADKPEHQTEQLMAVIIQRTLGMQKDADADLKSKGVDYRYRAKELLELVLQNKLELLHL